MTKVWSAVRTKAGLAVVGGALLLTGAGFGTAAATGALGTQTTSDSEPVVSTSAPTTEAPAPIEPATPAAEPGTPAPAATVDDVTTPQPAPAVDPAPAEQDRTGIGTTDAQGNYTPAPPIQRPGEPPVGDLSVGITPAEPLPGEPGYTPPATP